MVAVATLAGCRGEPVPRDYQNHPPGMTNPADNAREAPDPGSSTAAPETATGVEGNSGPYEPTRPTTTTPATTAP